MALRFNGLSPVGATPFSAMPCSQRGFTSGAVGNTANLITQWGRNERHLVKTAFGEKASNPPATQDPTAWTMADVGGELAAENSINQDNTITFNLQRGINMEGAMDADNAITSAALSMITSMVADMAAGNTLTGPMQMTMNLAANMAQSGDVNAALGLIAWCAADMAQSNSMSDSNLRGTMSMAANIVSYTEFTAEGVRDAVWNAILANYPTAGSAGNTLANAGAGGNPWSAIIEGGMTAEEVLRIVAAVLAGKVSGGGTGTEVFTGLDGTTARVTSVVDTNGNRTSVTVNGA